MAHGCKCQEKCIADEWLLSGNLRDAATHNHSDMDKMHIKKTGIHVIVLHAVCTLQFLSL